MTDKLRRSRIRWRQHNALISDSPVCNHSDLERSAPINIPERFICSPHVLCSVHRRQHTASTRAIYCLRSVTEDQVLLLHAFLVDDPGLEQLERRNNTHLFVLSAASPLSLARKISSLRCDKGQILTFSHKSQAYCSACFISSRVVVGFGVLVPSPGRFLFLTQVTMLRKVVWILFQQKQKHRMTEPLCPLTSVFSAESKTSSVTLAILGFLGKILTLHML